MLTAANAREILKTADVVCSAEAVTLAVQQVAAKLSTAFANANPLVLCVMTGAVVFTGQLLPLLGFPLDLDYIHVTRYGDATSGGRVEWKMFPATRVAGRTVLVIDDILDEGHTLVEVRRRVLEAGASGFYAAVFADKDIGRDKPIAADFVGVTLPNRFVFGFGLDVRGAWRNLPAVYAMKED